MTNRIYINEPGGTSLSRIGLISTNCLPPADRFEFYRQLILNLPVPLAVEPDIARMPPADFRASIETTRFGPISLTTLSTWPTTPFQVRRTRPLIRRADLDALRLVLNLRGRSHFTQAGNEALLERGDLALFDTSMPFAGQRGLARPGAVEQLLMVTFPRTRLWHQPDAVRPLLSQRVPGRGGVAGLLRTLIARMSCDAASFGPEQRPALATTLLDLIAMLATDLLGVEASEPEARRRIQLLRIQESMTSQLREPNLSPSAIASAHHISTRSLHRLFREHGLTVSGWLRRQRMERCRQDLENPALHSIPVHAIGERWGYLDATQFSRSFRATYGTSPAAYRNTAVNTDRTDDAG